MASKRKSKLPTKLFEEKRQCLTWNLADACQSIGDGKDSASIPGKFESHLTSSEEISMLGRSKAEISTPPYNKFTQKSKFKKNGIECENLYMPWLSIPIACSRCVEYESTRKDGFCIGPKVFQVLLAKEEIDSDWAFVANNSHCKSFFDCSFGKKKFLLKIFENRSPCDLVLEDRHRAEVHLCIKELCQKEREVGKWTWESKDKEYKLCIWTGNLVMPTAVLMSISKMVQEKQFRLVISPNELDKSELFIYARIIESDLGLMASDSSHIKKKYLKSHMETIMGYFFDVCEEMVYENTKQHFSFTANEIPALYHHIKSYHSQRFTIDLTDEEKSALDGFSDDAMLAASDDSNSSIPPLDHKRSFDNDLNSSSMKFDDEECCQDEFDEQKIEVDEIDGTIKELNISNQNVFGIKVDYLTPKLRKYQYAAVQWMISRENETEFELGPAEHILWRKLTLCDQEKLYYNPHNGRVCTKLHILPLPQGGILADEMGLGKTVEVFALILKNSRDKKFSLPDSGRPDLDDEDTTSNVIGGSVNELLCCFCGKHAKFNVKYCFGCRVPMHFRCAGTLGKNVLRYFCPMCGTKEVIKSHCTLIISPSAIVNQWIEEIERHIEKTTLKYFLYLGVGRGGYIQPSVLAEYDIIITTYEVLNGDFHHVKTEDGRDRKLRNRKKYMALPSPLIYLEFWRVCLDEAQMIQCPTTKLAEMALRLSAVHRWCVTGTPLQRGLEDIYGMLLFIGLFPYCIKPWWNKLLYQPLIHGNTKPLFDILARVMWRTEKEDVLDQINLPKQTETLKFLKFTPVEWQFYKRQEEVCTANVLQEIEKWTEKEIILNTLDKSSLHSLLAPLLRLRQACCHPRAVRDGVLGIHKSHLTMDKLLEGLKAKAKLDCEEAHRQLMCAINGLAAVDIIEGKFEDAVNKYREAVQSSAAHKDIFRTDLLQKLHTVKNLSFALTKSTSCSHALSDDNLETEAKELAREYMKKSESQVETAEEKIALMEENFEKFTGAIDWKSPWWIELLHGFKSDVMPASEEELITKVKNELTAQLHVSTFMGSRFTTIDGLQYLLVSKMTSLEDLRMKLKEFLATLKKEPTREIVLQTAECCLRNLEENALKTSVESEDAKRYGGLRAETELDVVLKTLFSLVRQNSTKEGLVNQAKAHISYMDLLKQEFKALRNLWFALHKRVSALDELEMSSIRLRLRYENENNKESYVINFHEIGLQRLKLATDRTVADHRLKKKKGQLFYLTNLEKAQNQSQDSNPETCPICEDKLGIEWAVFSCGHCFCCQCTTHLEQQYGIRFRRGGARLHCPMCREPTLSEEISFVVMTDRKDSDDDDIQVKGSYSVKIEAIVRKILEISKSDPDGKIIIFSTWQDVLSIISDALIENDVKFNYAVGSSKKFQASLAAFKSLPSNKVLLLPLKLGAKGLNIIEATHVILVEPTLNPANELQAVGRIHRIGQTRPTFVHRFMVRDTVEERIHHLLKIKSSNDVISNNDASSSLTIRDLSSLLI